jgi:hypothetical protein
MRAVVARGRGVGLRSDKEGGRADDNRRTHVAGDANPDGSGRTLDRGGARQLRGGRVLGVRFGGGWNLRRGDGRQSLRRGGVGDG